MTKEFKSLKAATPEIFLPCMEAKDEVYCIDGPSGRSNVKAGMKFLRPHGNTVSWYKLV